MRATDLVLVVALGAIADQMEEGSVAQVMPALADPAAHHLLNARFVFFAGQEAEGACSGLGRLRYMRLQDSQTAAVNKTTFDLELEA